MFHEKKYVILFIRFSRSFTMITLYLTPEDDLQTILDTVYEPATVYLKNGIYKQKIEIRRDNLTIVGEARETTVITYDDYARKIHRDGKEYNTFRTYTLCVTGNNVKIFNITVENSNADPREAGQCVALSVHAKNFRAENICLKSMQDTLYLAPFPDDLVVRYDGFIPRNQLYTEGSNLHIFEKCRICGTVDFIFGCAEAYFKDCEIISLHDERGYGFVSAPAHSLKQEHGFYFIGCDFKSEGAEDGSVYLARPWRDFGKSVFVNCKLGKHIKPELFDKWNDTARDRTARFLYGGLDCAFSPAPVEWSREIPNSLSEKIIERMNCKLKSI